MVQSIFRYLEPLRRDSKSVTDRRTDRPTDILVANAALNYVAPPKKYTAVFNNPARHPYEKHRPASQQSL